MTAFPPENLLLHCMTGAVQLPDKVRYSNKGFYYSLTF